MSDTNRLSHIEIDDTGLPAPTPEIDQERKVAVYDLLEANVFGLPKVEGKDIPDGPYHLFLSIRDGRLVFDIQTEAHEKAAEFHLSLSPFRQVVKDYFQICAAYFDAVKRLPPSQIEAIDMGRRGIHDEGSRVLQERLEGKVEVDTATARRLFTLICVLHFKG
ncbi:MAG: UPF0262 family protein [Rhodobacteraceae bacterium]|nr:UPF0262 family protein [Paracoccaceae bacterium]MCB1368954.1 UPF0262 family protein [Paracoccaceae bacterium]